MTTPAKKTFDYKRTQFEIPILISRLDAGLYSAMPLYFPEMELVGQSVNDFPRRFRAYFNRYLRRHGGQALLQRLPRSFPERYSQTVTIEPPENQDYWRIPIHLECEGARWQAARQITAIAFPRLQNMVVTTDDDQLINSVQFQTLIALGRMEATKKLSNLWPLESRSKSIIRKLRVSLKVPTPKQLMIDAKRDSVDSQSPIKQFVTDLTESVLEPAFEREALVQQLADQLQNRHRRSLLLVGPSGVGKTAIFHEVVRRREALGLGQRAFWSTSGARILAGQSGFGMWQQRCRTLIDEAQKADAVIHFGPLLELVEAGRCGGQAGIISSLTEPMSAGKFTAIVECSPEQRDLLLRRDPRLLNVFQAITIEPPDTSTLQTILLETALHPVAMPQKTPNPSRQRRQERKLKRKQAVKPNALPTVHPEALQQIDRLHRRFATYSALPGRPIRFLRQLLGDARPGQELRAIDVQRAFAQQTGLPDFLIQHELPLDLAELRNMLASQVIGQPQVIDTLVGLVATLKADLSRGDRPLASLLLIGPTGVGKTETAKALARLFYRDPQRTIRIDMSEFSAPWAVPRLVGGYGQPGALTAPVRSQPFSVVLLDEFEKAHASVFDILLQILGEGRLTDNAGQTADFRNSIVLLTSNLGVESFRAQGTGFGSGGTIEYAEHFDRQVRQFLRPELYNRLDRVLAYQPLSPETLYAITRQQIEQLGARDGLQMRDVTWSIDESAIQQIAEMSYEPQYGARPLKRVIQREVVVPIASRLAELSEHVPVTIRLAAGEHRPIVEVIPVTPRIRSAVSAENQARSDLIARAVVQREQSQRLEHAPHVLQLRNRTSQLEQLLKSLRKQKSAKAKGRFQQTEALVYRSRQMLDRIENLVARGCRHESVLLQLVYRHHPVDADHWTNLFEQYHEDLWNALLELLSDGKLHNQTVTTAILGRNVSTYDPLLRAYLMSAARQMYNTKVYWLINLNDLPRPEAFKVSTRKKPVSHADIMFGSLIEDPTILHFEPPATEYQLGAVEMIAQGELHQPPRQAIGVLVQMSGFAAALRMKEEAGMHAFRPDFAPDGHQDESVCVEVITESAASYQAPIGLADRTIPTHGSPVRFYNGSNRTLHDFGLDATFSWSNADRALPIVPVMQKAFEKKIWDQLEA